MQPEAGADGFIEVRQFFLYPRVRVERAQLLAQGEERREGRGGLAVVELLENLPDLFADPGGSRDARPGRVDAVNDAAARDWFAVEELEIFLPFAAADFDAETLAL